MNWFLRGLRAGILPKGRRGAGTWPRDYHRGCRRPRPSRRKKRLRSFRSARPMRSCARRIVDVSSIVASPAMRCKRPGSNGGTTSGGRTRQTASEPLAGRFASVDSRSHRRCRDCGACLNEFAQLNGPSYNLHRFGIFITPTPRQADVLLVVGPVTRQMLDPLKAAYDAMPTPKRVVAVGACAASGGIFGPSVMCAAGRRRVPGRSRGPGCPPPPLALVHALRAVCGQESLA